MAWWSWSLAAPGAWGLGCLAIVLVILSLVVLGLFKLILSFGGF